MNHPKPSRRRGTVAVVSLVCLAIAVSLGATLLTASLRQRLQGRQEHAARQAEELLAAGAARAAVALRDDPEYEGETWTPTPPEPLAGSELSVSIVVDREAAQLRVTATYDPLAVLPIRRSQAFALPPSSAGDDG